MNILDENIVENQCKLLRSWRIPFRQIGSGVGRQGMKDQEIIPLLHELRSPTFFTRDEGFFNRKLCHSKYSIVFLAVRKNESAVFVRRLLRHKELNTKSKRMGCIIRASQAGLTIWRIRTEKEVRHDWTD